MAPLNNTAATPDRTRDNNGRTRVGLICQERAERNSTTSTPSANTPTVCKGSLPASGTTITRDKSPSSATWAYTKSGHPTTATNNPAAVHCANTSANHTEDADTWLTARRGKPPPGNNPPTAPPNGTTSCRTPAAPTPLPDRTDFSSPPRKPPSETAASAFSRAPSATTASGRTEPGTTRKGSRPTPAETPIAAAEGKLLALTKSAPESAAFRRSSANTANFSCATMFDNLAPSPQSMAANFRTPVPVMRSC
ncbi:hypothetical protein CAQU_02345 [Corynebacterium aquilae DSM 44791]|uniref:Uncharacterized protein n=1 Tax=Corynebacterium aquilae DSM 44791 TaxID=1431546 RepID=A0A1L7CE08_9CORY|nr:hypothetical protein CAQU_02345 [Corynebacterium aquilae DSM 44791]